tara:strand:- start:231 stop:980 length:750 start_codon:yes stop_codon:yes gene_type:complete
MKKFSGLEIGRIKKNLKSQNLFKKKYQYSIVSLNRNLKYLSKTFNLGSIAIIKTYAKNSKIIINDKEFDANNHKYFTFGFKEIKLEANKKIIIGIAGIKSKIKINRIKSFKEKEVYKVKKPWGYELWINGQVPTYSFKKIFIKKGNRTSLQFHKKKIETNFLFKGSAELTLSKKNGKFKKSQILKNIYKKKIYSGSFVNVKNYAVHRLKAISDILLYEVSTPHLDDVIRLVDDKKRKDGRISSEHFKKN